MMALSTILNILWLLFKIIVIPLIIIFIFIIIFKSINEYRKYGKSIFSAFKTKDISNTREELLHISLDKITWYKKIIKVPYLKSNYILIDGNGITLFKIFTKVGSFEGTNNSKYLYYRSNGKEYRITSPIISLTNDEKILKNILPGVGIFKYLVVTEGTYVGNIEGINQINFNKLPYGLPEGNKYNETEVNDIENKLVSKSV